MELPLLTKVITHVNVASSEPEILVDLIIVIHASNFEIMDKIKDKLTATKLSGFPGYNVEFYCDHKLGLLQRLDGDGFLQPQHISCLTFSLTQCISPAFQLWELNQNNFVS